MTEVASSLLRLRHTLADLGEAAIAVSGGIDSLTLAEVAHRELGARAQVFHAVSPAVPERATRRVRDRAASEGWPLCIFDAGEFSDERYIANPVDRCLFCKRNLYGAIRRQTEATILSGTNLDDLGDYRPGLIAAAELEVRHPFLEARIDKAGVRALARELGLGGLSELPASPCLSSRVESGIRIDAATLRAVERVEEILRRALRPRTARCRVRRESIEVELDEPTLLALSAEIRARLDAEIRDVFLSIGIDRALEFACYRRGSAFLTEGASA